MTEALTRAVLVGVGGGLGALSRYGLNGAAVAAFGPRFPLGTLAANVLGCLAAGVLAHLLYEREALTLEARLFLMVGYLGGLTTFSSFSYETLLLLRERGPGLAGLNIAANLVLSLAAVGAGWTAARLAAGE
jgi:CrcB protein